MRCVSWRFDSGCNWRHRGRDTIYVHARTYVENMDMRNRLRLIGDGTGTAATNVYMDIEKY
ncbi:MAG: hypothetical protein HF975_15365 [ANME-2 cluster archaeon]|nr:hypothetical protein [ANME-2 cluster archaeon]